MTINVTLQALSLASIVFFYTAHASHAEPRAGITCDPRIYGATNDGTTDNTVMFQKTIDDCAASGGGIVRITGGGTYITGPISLRSHIHLLIDGGTILTTAARS
jgi:polygalacturonase